MTVKCPNCEIELSELVCHESITMRYAFDGQIYTEDGDDMENPPVTPDETGFVCPYCDVKIADTEQKAQQFLLGRKTVKEIETDEDEESEEDQEGTSYR